MGLAAILAMTLADMGVNSNKQLNNLKSSLEREAIRQTLQSIVLNQGTCTGAVQMDAFGPALAGVPGLGQPNVRVRFALSPGVILADGVNIPNYRLRVDWLRAFNPTAVAAAHLVPPQRMYTAQLRIKLTPTDGTSIDLKYVDIGRVFFTTSNAIGVGNIVSCYGYAQEVASCPSPDQIQIFRGGVWTCMTMDQYLYEKCGSQPNRLIGTGAAANTLACSGVSYRVTNGNCEGFGNLSNQASCQTRACTYNITKVVPLGGTLPPASVVVKETGFLNCAGGCNNAAAAPFACPNTISL